MKAFWEKENKPMNYILLIMSAAASKNHIQCSSTTLSISASPLVGEKMEGAENPQVRWKREDCRVQFQQNLKMYKAFCLPASCKAVLPCRSTFPTGQLCWNTKHSSHSQSCHSQTLQGPEALKGQRMSLNFQKHPWWLPAPKQMNTKTKNGPEWHGCVRL